MNQLMVRGFDDELRALLSEFVTTYEDYILPLGRTEAEWAARFRALAHRSGRILDMGDAPIAGTAKAHDISGDRPHTSRTLRRVG